MVEHLDRMSRQLEQVQDTVDSLRRMLAGDQAEVGGRATATSPPPWCSPSAATSTATRWSSWWVEAFTELHRLLRTAVHHAHRPRRCGVPDRVLHRGRRGARGLRPRRPGAGAVRPGRGGRPVRRARYAVARHDGPMVDLDGAYSAVGRAVVDRALAADGPLVERYLPAGRRGRPPRPPHRGVLAGDRMSHEGMA